ncbi:MAG: exopolysaccharide biosynthesis polyprenyl glycosylphosphotransferase [Solirubrobacteraceae bacterium]
MANENTEHTLFSIAAEAQPVALPRHAGGRREAFPRFGAAQRRAAEVVADPALPLETDVVPDVASRERLYRRTLALADAVAAAGAAVLAIAVLGGFGLTPGFLLIAPAIVLVAKTQGLYDRDELVIHKSTLSEFPRLLNLATLFALLLWLARHYVVVGNPGTAYLLALWLLLIATLTASRASARTLAARFSAPERCLLVGSPIVQRRLAAKLDGQQHAELAGALTFEQVVRDPHCLRRTAALVGAHRVVLAHSEHSDAEETMDVVRCAMASGLSVSLLPNSIGAVGSSVAFDDLGGMPLLGVPRFGLSRSSRTIKRSFDLIGAGISLIFAAPVLAVAAVAIKRESPGPVLFRQTRVGREGQHFTMLKLRTMVDDAERMKADLLERNEANGLFKIEDDPRITRVGRLLRKTSLDELPQLFNVLHGDMSLVGPRPLVLDEDKRVTGYDRRRLHLTPGMTGRWQTLGSARIPLSEMVKIDYLYVANWSLWADLKIMLETVAFVVRRRGL